jgi:hypothetical protein
VNVPQSGRPGHKQSHFIISRGEKMTKEAILKLLAALGVKVSIDGAEGTMKEDDAIKLVEDQFNASNLGLVQKRDELLGEVVKQKEKITAMEATASEANRKIGELDAQLKKNSPEENRKFYDAKLAEEKAKFEQDIAGVTAERDKFRESHYTRVRNDAINEATKNIKFINDSYREGFIALIEKQNQFKPIDPNKDGNIVFTNQENKSIQAVLHDFSLSNTGKAFIQNGNQGGNAQGGNDQGAPGQGGQTMSRADFGALTAQAKMDFTSKGGTVTD